MLVALTLRYRFIPPREIDVQLDLAARNFVAIDVKVDTSGHKLHLSAIFNWFKGDFGGQEGVIDFLKNYLPEDKRKAWLGKKQRQN